MDHQSFIPELRSVHKIQAFVKQHLAGKVSDKKKLLHIDLVIEEISVNIIKYGFRNRNDGVINIEIKIQADHVILIFTDNGIAFNPLEKDIPDTKAALDNSQPGGLGLFLVKQITKSIQYARKKNFNILSLEIDL